jgi:hypothetical protein
MLDHQVDEFEGSKTKPFGFGSICPFRYSGRDDQSGILVIMARVRSIRGAGVA